MEPHRSDLDSWVADSCSELHYSGTPLVALIALDIGDRIPQLLEQSGILHPVKNMSDSCFRHYNRVVLMNNSVLGHQHCCFVDMAPAVCCWSIVDLGHA
jgi:hypothetical protein